MTRHFTVGRWVIEISTRARREWNHIHHWRSRETTAQSWIWGRFVFGIEDWTAEVYPLCAQCDSPDIGEVSCGDEGWTVCQSCRSVEQGYRYVNLREFENAT
jgi:hypothetical protein